MSSGRLSAVSITTGTAEKLAQLHAHFEPVHARHQDVEQHQIKAILAEQRQRFRAVGRGHHLIPHTLQRKLQ